MMTNIAPLPPAPYLQGLSVDKEIKLAKKWGKAVGYKGRAGGWIYSPVTNRPVAQGWLALWFRSRRTISAWAVAKGLASWNDGKGTR